MELAVVPIHTSDRLSFKGCRERWNFLSDLRLGYKPIATPQPLSFGTAIHAGFETFYDPTTWGLTKDPATREVIVNAACQAFVDSMAEHKKRYLKLTNQEGLEPEKRDEYNEAIDLGVGMLRHYFSYVWDHNLDRFTPVGKEIGFAVPIFSLEEQNDLFPHLIGQQILYKGRIDLLAVDEWNELWVWDHKTTSRMRDNMEHLELDEQLGSYNWAYQVATGQKVAGNVYAEVYKDYPKPPPENKVVRLGRKFSVAKQNMATSYDIYLKTITEAGEDIELYEDMLYWLKNFGTQYVRRTQIHRSQAELNILHERIKMEVQDMLDPNVRIYPSPGPFKCDWCPMRMPCLAKQDGSDVQWILDTHYTKEKRTNA